MDPTLAPDPQAMIETLRATLEDYEHRFEMLDGQVRVLERERQKLSAVVNNTDAGFFTMGADLHLIWANRACPALLNTESPAALFDQPCNTVLCGEAGICETCPVALSARVGQVAHRELRLELGAGERHIYVTSIPIKSLDGVVEETMVMLQDVSDLEVLRREKAVAQLVQDVAVAANEAGTVDEALQTCLDRVCAYTGWPVGHVYLVPDPNRDALVSTNLWHADDPGRFETLRRITEVTPMSRGVGLPGRVLASGTAQWITDVTQDSNSPRGRAASDLGVKAAFGFPVMVGREVAAVLEFFLPQARQPDQRLLDVMHSIGSQIGRVVERERSGRALRESESQLRHAQKMEAIGRLAGGVAHDFNNLLTVIMGHTELILERRGRPEESTRELEDIRRAAERAADLTRQLLAFSRKQVLQPRLVDLNAAVTGMETMLRRLIGENIQLTTKLEPGLGVVRAEGGQIEQVILNLVVNARDAMVGGGTIAVETSAVDFAPDDGPGGPHAGAVPHVTLTVRDTGRGMDESVRARLFEPFFTTKERGKGTGLGLSTVYGIVRQSGGRIEVESSPGSGTVFRVHLPRAEDAAPPPALRPAAAEMRPAHETILLVEDEVSVRQLTVEILRRGGYGVLEARDPADARLLCERHEGVIHLMLTDIVMPLMSGVELAEYLSPLRPTMKILFMSGYTNESLVLDGSTGRAAAFIQKPFTPETLVAAIRELLDAPAQAAP